MLGHHKAERDVVNECLIALSDAGCMVWRNNTGAMPNATGRLVRFGLCVGSSDIIGLCADGRFLAVECKAGRGRLTEDQERFLAAVRRQGGRSGVARSGAEAVAIATPAHKLTG